MATRRRWFLLIALGSLIVLAGCVGLGDEAEDSLETASQEESPEESEVEAWAASDEAEMGTLAGASSEAGWVWVPGPDHCHRLAVEILPGAGTDSFALDVQPEPVGNTAAGMYASVALSNPDGEVVDEQSWPDDDLVFEVQDPMAGPWILEIPQGAGVDAAWPVDGAASGEGQRALDAFLFQDC